MNRPCPKHKTQMSLVESKEYPGKTIEVCADCAKDRAGFMAQFPRVPLDDSESIHVWNEACAEGRNRDMIHMRDTLALVLNGEASDRKAQAEHGGYILDDIVRDNVVNALNRANEILGDPDLWPAWKEFQQAGQTAQPPAKPLDFQADFDKTWKTRPSMHSRITQQAARRWYTRGRVDQDAAMQGNLVQSRLIESAEKMQEEISAGEANQECKP